MKQASEKAGYFPVVFSFSTDVQYTPDESEVALALLDICTKVKLSGLVLFTEGIALSIDSISETLTKIVRDLHIPVYVNDRDVDGCFTVKYKYGSGFRALVDHVIEEHDCQTIDMMAGMRGNDFSDERIAAYRESLEAHGIEYDERRVKYGDFWSLPTKEAMHEILTDDLSLPDAIVCANDSMAITVCEELRSAGHRVPEDIIVTGFDGIEHARMFSPSVTTAIPDFHTASREIVESIEEISRSGIIKTRDMNIESIPILRESCGCIKPDIVRTNESMENLYNSITDEEWFINDMGRTVTKLLSSESLWDVSVLLPERLSTETRGIHYFGLYIYANYFHEYEGFDDYVVPLLSGYGSKLAPDRNIYPAKTFIPNFESIVNDDNDVSILMVRLINSGKKFFGYMVEGFDTIESINTRQCEELGFFISATINSIINNKQRNYLYSHDHLTDLYNRHGFFEQLHDLLLKPENRGSMLYLISVDMDDLKVINDTYGHGEGDTALHEMGSSLRCAALAVSQTSISARYGGDEFAAAIITREPMPTLEETVRRIMDSALEVSESLKCKNYSVRGSMGVAGARIDDSLDIEALINDADRAMYINKRERKAGR